MIRENIGLLTLAQHEVGAPQAMAVYDQKEGTERCEQSAAAALLENLPALDGKMIAADPIHCQKKSACAIVEKGGDYLLQIKGNQPSLLERAHAFDALENTPFLSCTVRIGKRWASGCRRHCGGFQKCKNMHTDP